MAEETYSVSIGKQAKSRLREIVKYLIENASEQTTDYYVEAGIFDIIEGLSSMPERYDLP